MSFIDPSLFLMNVLCMLYAQRPVAIVIHCIVENKVFSHFMLKMGLLVALGSTLLFEKYNAPH